MTKTINCMRCGRPVEVHSNTWRTYCEQCRAEVYAENSSLRNSAKYRKTAKGRIAKQKNEKNGKACKRYYEKVQSDPIKWERLQERARKYAARTRCQKYEDRYQHQKESLDLVDKLLQEEGKREHTFMKLVDSFTGRRLRCDAYYPEHNVVVEVNGAQHYIPVRFGNISLEKAQQNLLDYQRRDRIKQKFCMQNGIKYVVIPYTVSGDLLKQSLEEQLQNQQPVKITKQFRFAYAHRLESKILDPQTNSELFGKCNNPAGHGHNGRLQVTLKGLVDPLSGMVINFKTLKEIVNRVIDEQYDHKNLNQDSHSFDNCPSTCENTLKVMWEQLQKELILLDELVMYEEDDSSCSYRKETE